MGRRSQLDEIKRAKGNPGKRKLIPKPALADNSGVVKAPDFTSGKLEKELVARLIHNPHHATFLRATDMSAVGRWAYYMAQWIECKNFFAKNKFTYDSESEHVKMVRLHPRVSVMFRLEGALQSLEDKLGLSPISRQALLRGLFNADPNPGGLFATPTEEPSQQPSQVEPVENALGFLTTSKH